MILTGFSCLGAYFCAQKLIHARSNVVIPRIGIAMGFLLHIGISWLRALLKGCRCWCWCCGPGCWCGVVSWQSAPVPVSAACARCGGAVSWLCILVPASLMSTGRGILPSYLGLCWCNFKQVLEEHCFGPSDPRYGPFGSEHGLSNSPLLPPLSSSPTRTSRARSRSSSRSSKRSRGPSPFHRTRSFLLVVMPGVPRS